MARSLVDDSTMIGSLRMIELQLVGFIMVFSASGLVSLFDLIFPAFASTYLLLLSLFAFPTSSSSSAVAVEINGSLLRLNAMLGTTVGLLLPLAYVLGGFAKGDEHAVRLATPHLFLLSVQILTEKIIAGVSTFSPPVRVMVPILYTVRRIFVVLDWVVHVLCVDGKKPLISADYAFKDVAWVWFGKSLAVSNMAYLSLNLFGILIPRQLPAAFRRYFFVEKDEKKE